MKAILDIRRENLRAAISAAGGPSKFLLAVGEKYDGELSSSYLSQLIGRGSFGDEAARKLERAMCAEVNWLDHEHGGANARRKVIRWVNLNRCDEWATTASAHHYETEADAKRDAHSGEQLGDTFIAIAVPIQVDL